MEYNRYMIVLLVLSIFFILLLLRKYIMDHSPTNNKEGFIQEPPFIVKRNENTYDEFVSKIYDKIFHIDKEPYYDEINLFEQTEPTPEYSVILDVGCGTGVLLNKLRQKGFYSSFGLDKSTAMGLECLNKYPELKVKIGDATNDPMLFERGVFTHIFCVDMTIYEMKDKITFFRNCYYWLKPNSHLILHLVNRQTFDTIVPAGKPLLVDGNTNNCMSPQKYSNVRITDTEIDFGNFKYSSSYDFSKKDVVIFTETFVDSASSKIRKNERELYMNNSMENILYDAQYCGFIVVGQITMKKDENQFLFLLERPM